MAVIPAPTGQPIVGNQWWWQNPLDPYYDAKGIVGNASDTVKQAVNIAKTVKKVVTTPVQAATTTADAVSYGVTYAKYWGIWVGLFALGLVLIIKGLGISTPTPTKIVPVPV